MILNKIQETCEWESVYIGTLAECDSKIYAVVGVLMHACNLRTWEIERYNLKIKDILVHVVFEASMGYMQPYLKRKQIIRAG